MTLEEIAKAKKDFDSQMELMFLLGLICAGIPLLVMIPVYVFIRHYEFKELDSKLAN